MYINIKKFSNFERFRCLSRSSSDSYEGEAILLCCGSVVRSSCGLWIFPLLRWLFLHRTVLRLIILFNLHRCPIRFYFVIRLTYIFMNTVLLSHLWLWDVQLGHSLIKLKALAIRNSLPISSIFLPVRKRNEILFHLIFLLSLIVRGETEDVPPTIVFGLPAGSAAVEPSGALAVYPGSILHLECLFARKLGNPEWTWTSTFRQYLTGKPSDDRRRFIANCALWYRACINKLSPTIVR